MRTRAIRAVVATVLVGAGCGGAGGTGAREPETGRSEISARETAARETPAGTREPETGRSEISARETAAAAAAAAAAARLTGVMVGIPAGTFTMGSPASETGRSGDEDQHRVTITRAFELKETEVTQGEWQEVMGSNPSRFKDCGANCPVEEVSWYDAIAYCNALSVKAGVERCYKDGAKDYDASSASSMTTPEWPKGLDCRGYRLPTEAEWEYAARAGTTSAVYANLGEAAWYSDNSGPTTHAVKQKQGNAWGLHDMLGNVWEWTWDGYASYSGGEQRDPTGPATGAGRVYRGGSWDCDAQSARAVLRVAGTPDDQDGYLGFRLARGQ